MFVHYVPSLRTVEYTDYITLVADNCYSSKRHKFVNFRLNFNHFEFKMK